VRAGERRAFVEKLQVVLVPGVGILGLLFEHGVGALDALGPRRPCPPCPLPPLL
jgi:hypothetical protein